VGAGVFVRRGVTLRSLRGDKTHGGDPLLHCSDLCS
jgi:hypothetical protein